MTACLSSLSPLITRGISVIAVEFPPTPEPSSASLLFACAGTLVFFLARRRRR